MKEKYLPIGTVVLLKEATKTLMITGYCSATPDDPNVMYDYVAYLFPEGSLAGDNVALFNHDQIGSIIYMGLVNDEFKKLDGVIKQSLVEEKAAPAAPTAAAPDAANGTLPPFTPENINLFLQEIHKHEDELKPISEPTAFDEEVIKKPTFELPSLDGGNKKEEKEVEEEVEEPEVEEEEVEETPKKEVVADGQPVLQLQPIFDDASAGSASSEPSTPVSGGIPGLTRL